MTLNRVHGPYTIFGFQLVYDPNLMAHLVLKVLYGLYRAANMCEPRFTWLGDWRYVILYKEML